jgi:hypothetical protein
VHRPEWRGSGSGARRGDVRADLIVVLRDGHVVEQGTHADLLARSSYHELWQQQQALVVSEDGQRGTMEAARLGEIPLLRWVDGSSLALLASLFVSETYRAGEEIIREG